MFLPSLGYFFFERLTFLIDLFGSLELDLLLFQVDRIDEFFFSGTIFVKFYKTLRFHLGLYKLNSCSFTSKKLLDCSFHFGKLTIGAKLVTNL